MVIAQGYQGSLRWDWNVYLQDYFGVFGEPKRENWKQDEILRAITMDSSERNVSPRVAIVPDLPRFNESNFTLYARMRGLPVQMRHLQSAEGVRSFDGYNYVVMAEGEQGMSWTTGFSKAMNQIIVDHPEVFRLVDTYPLPGDNGARLYFIQWPVASSQSPVR
jgi:hypothetical protein